MNCVLAQKALDLCTEGCRHGIGKVAVYLRAVRPRNVKAEDDGCSFRNSGKVCLEPLHLVVCEAFGIILDIVVV